MGGVGGVGVGVKMGYEEGELELGIVGLKRECLLFQCLFIHVHS